MMTEGLIKDNPKIKRQVRKLIEQFEHHERTTDDSLSLSIQPNLIIYGTLIQGAGCDADIGYYYV